MSAADTVPDMLEADRAAVLRRLGKRVEEATQRRNDLVRELHASGAGIREIGRAVGLAPATVLNIITPRKR